MSVNRITKENLRYSIDRFQTLMVLGIFSISMLSCLYYYHPVHAQLINLIDKDHIWKPITYTKVLQTNGRLNISTITDYPGKEFNRAVLQTQINNLTEKRPLLLSMKYASKSFYGKATFVVEIRDNNGSKILWNSYLNDTNGNFTNPSFILPNNITGKPIQLRLYTITDGHGLHNLSIRNATIEYARTTGSSSITSTSIIAKNNANNRAASQPAVSNKNNTHMSGPSLADPTLKTQLLFKGLKFPTTMAFLGPNDILVLEKDTGTVVRIVNGTLQSQPLLDVSVANLDERGMLGIAVSKYIHGPTYVFLYYTVSGKGKDGDDASGVIPLGNRLYRYELINNKLLNPKLLLDLPATPGPRHNGGAISIGPDGNIYIPIGDLGDFNGHKTTAENVKNGTYADGTGGILRITQDGKPVQQKDGKPVQQKDGTVGIIGNKFPLNLYYAYGLRNSFGIDFDPVTKKLWDTENGPWYGDEINLYEPGYNGGWRVAQGLWYTKNGPTMKNITQNPNNLEYFAGRGKYSPPEFTWYYTVAPTGIKFLNSDKLGEKYKNDLFVGDKNNGNIYHFKLNENRTQLDLHGPLVDKVADSPEELQDIIFGKGFGGITDLEVGPDGYLYVVAPGLGSIYRIVQLNN
jgi:aldose sugar dehydrogenase